jgi:isoleucyl-tRNA synthetase
VEKWERFQQIREIVMRPMEELRREKTIGKSRDAAVTLRPRTRELARFLTENAVLLRDFFIVSYLNVDAGAATEEGPFALDQDLRVQVAKAPGEKCARCWTFSEEVGADQEHPQLCRRCAGVVRRLL